MQVLNYAHRLLLQLKCEFNLEFCFSFLAAVVALAGVRRLDIELQDNGLGDRGASHFAHVFAGSAGFSNVSFTNSQTLPLIDILLN